MRISDWSSDVCSSDLLAREVEFAIPREMTEEQGIELARDFVRDGFVERGMIADLNVHWDIGADGLARPHAHVMLTMREIRIGERSAAHTSELHSLMRISYAFFCLTTKNDNKHTPPYLITTQHTI